MTSNDMRVKNTLKVNTENNNNDDNSDRVKISNNLTITLKTGLKLCFFFSLAFQPIALQLTYWAEIWTASTQ